MSTTSRQEILELLSSGKITADEAAQLLSQMKETAGAPAPQANPEPAPAPQPKPAPEPELKAESGQEGRGPTWFRVRVSDMETGKNKVTVNIPVRMLKLGFTLGKRFSPEMAQLDWQEIDALVDDVSSGVLVDVQNEEEREHVQIYLE